MIMSRFVTQSAAGIALAILVAAVLYGHFVSDTTPEHSTNRHHTSHSHTEGR